MPHTRTIAIVVSCLAITRLAAADDAAPLTVESLPDEAAITEIDRSHWAFQPLTAVVPPAVTDAGWCRTPIDRFILAELERDGLQPMPVADRRTLLRRVTFDLTGLPPTPEETAQFLSDNAPDAWERRVDRLLATPAYGERWAMFWLDLARFAETDGFEFDHVRPEAWRYRDWVVDALNRDLPYDQFVAAQLAADELYPGDEAALVATGYLLAGPDMPDVNSQEERRHVLLNSLTANVGEVLLGLQYGCCQCHDHKADPLSQRDFYRLRAFFDPLDLFRGQQLTDTADDPRITGGGARIAQVAAGPVPPSRVWIRGDYRRAGPEVQAGYPRVALRPGESAALDNPQHQPRSRLAAWLTSPDNPLTARVIVNRLWQHHFGAGLSGSPSDFGLLGQEPSHPQLLDWLAAELPRQNWSLKALHRMMVTSAVYQSASRPAAGDDAVWRELVERDPSNGRGGRMTRRRLEGETLRDAMLAVCGQLNREPGGPGVRPPLPPEVVKTLLKDQWPVTPDAGQHLRRSLYLFARRNLKYPLFDAFDRPDQNLSCARRAQTTIAPQALVLLNSGFSADCADRLAAHCAADAHTDTAQSVRNCYAAALGREPTAAELHRSCDFVLAGRENGLRDLCLALLNAGEFLYID